MSEYVMGPCPFCGATSPGIGLATMMADRAYRVSCRCGVQGPVTRRSADEPWGSQCEAVEAWNTRAAAPTPPAGGPLEIECRQCYNCNHAGINDESDTQGACFNCDWQGPAQTEDLCPECGKEGTMTAACPKCGHRYTLIANKSINAPQSAAAPREPAPAVGGWSGWAVKYPGKMPKLYGKRFIAELNWYPEEGAKLIYLSEQPVSAPPVDSEESLPDFLRRVGEQIAARDTLPGNFAAGVRDSLRGRASILEAVQARRQQGES